MQTIKASEFADDQTCRTLLKTCRVCGRPTRKKCPNCNDAYFCSQDHFQQQWPAHREICGNAPAESAEHQLVPFDRIMGTIHTLCVRRPAFAPGSIWEVVSANDSEMTLKKLTWSEFVSKHRSNLSNVTQGWFDAQLQLLDDGVLLVCQFEPNAGSYVGALRIIFDTVH